MIRHNFKKQYGQNFLVSTRFADELIDALEIHEGDTVIEIGPGDGMITNAILNGFEENIRVFAVEVDYDLLPNLIKRFSSHPNFKLIHKDVLELDLEEMLQENNIEGEIKIIGALPYNISKKIIDKFLNFSVIKNDKYKVSKLAFIVQEEVAKDYVAKAPQSTFLSNYVEFFGSARKFKSIPNHKFFPMPKVNGAILQFNLNNELNQDYPAIKKLIRLGFASPRKTLFRNLSNVKELKEKNLQAIFAEIGITPTARPAELTHEQWKNLFEKLKD